MQKKQMLMTWKINRARGVENPINLNGYVAFTCQLCLWGSFLHCWLFLFVC